MSKERLIKGSTVLQRKVAESPSLVHTSKEIISQRMRESQKIRDTSRVGLSPSSEIQ